MEDKIKLEEELEFLKESFEAEVISKEEYEKAKARIENQLKDIEAKEKIEEEKAEEKKEEIKPEVKEEKKEEVKEERPEIKEEAEKKVEEKKPAIKEITTEKAIEKKEEVKEIKKEEPEIEIKEIKESSRFKEPGEEEVKKEEKIEEEAEKEGPKRELAEKEEDTNDILNFGREFKVEEGEKKKKINIGVIAAIIVFLIVVGYFSFSFFTTEERIEKSIEVLPLCFSDTDCVKEGMIGFCNNPGSEDAECEFKEAMQINLIVLNAEDCFNCDTSRVEEIINGWFPGVVKEKIEFNSEEGALLVNELDIELLPAYIFDSSLEETFKYKELEGIFSKVSDKYILSPSASGSTFYVNKQAIPNRLDVFLMKDDKLTEKAEENIKEFLDLFNDKINYNKYLVNKESNLVKSLDINTFPTFLVNNKIRFSGVQPSETIKENFCKLNELEECSEKLTESLV